MSRRSAGALIIFLFVTTGLLAQDQPFRINVNVALVMLDAVVHDGTGHAVTDLKQTDFQIFDDGEIQELSYFATSETPRSMLLLFDISGSTNEQRPFMVQACNVFLSLMRPFDRVSLASFAGGFQTLMNWRTMVEGKPKEILMPEIQYSSNVYPSIEAGLERFKDEKGRKGMVVMTDGRDTTFFGEIQGTRKIPDPEADRGFQKVVQEVKKRGVPLYIIAMNTDRNHTLTGSRWDTEFNTIEGLMGKTGGEKYLAAVRMRLEKLAEVTGGRILYPRSLEEIAPLYEAIGRELGLSYSFGYIPAKGSNEARPRRIEVRVQRTGLKVNQSREFYVPK